MIKVSSSAVKWSAVGLFAALTTGVAIRTLFIYDRSSEESFVAADELAQQAAVRYSALESVPIAETSGIEDVRRVLRDAALQVETGVNGDETSAVVNLAAEFLFWRFVVADPVQYRNWRAIRGDKFLDIEELESRLFVRSDYEELYQEDFPGVESAFDRMFRDSLIRYSGHNRPIAFTLGPEAARLQIRVINPQIDQWIGTFGSPALDAYWFGKYNGAMRGWFVGSVAFNRAYTEQSRLAVATVSAILHFEDGSRRPVCMYLFREPGANGKWNLAKIATYNTPMDTVSILEF